MLCTLILLGGTILQTMPNQVANAADTTQLREWDIITSEDSALTVVNTTAGSVVKAGSKSDCNINLPDDISEGNLALYVKLNVNADDTSLALLNTYKNTYIELCNEKADQGERNWEIGSQYGLVSGENELVLRFDASSYHHGTDGMFPFDYQETINFFRFYTGNSDNSYTTDMNCKVEVTELRIVYTDAGLEFGQDGDDTYLQLSNTLSENPTTIEASIKKDVIEPEATEWTLVNAQAITCTSSRLTWGGAFDVTIPEEYVTSLENIADNQLAISFTITSDQSLSITEGQLEVTDKGSRDDTNEIRVNLGGKSLNIGANEFILPLKDFVRGSSASIDLAKLNYIWFYTQGGVTGSFKLSDVKLYVMQEEEITEWALGVAENGYSTSNEYSTQRTAEGAEPGTDIAYQLNTVSASQLQFWQANTVTLPEKYYTSTSDLANSDLAVAFWLYVKDDVKFGNIDARFQLTAKGASDYTIRYMIRDLNTLTAGWNYVVLPLRLFVSNQTAEVSITGFDKFYLYAVNQSNSFGLADVKLIVLEEDLDTNWKIADGFIYDSSRNSGNTYSYVGAMAYMGTVQPDEEGPEVGTTYAETTLSNKTLMFARTLTNPIPDTYKLNSVEDRLSSKLAVSLWMYSSVDMVLNNGQLELTSSGARNDNHEIRFNTGKHPITLSSGWNYVVMPFSQFDYTDNSTADGTLDLDNLNYLYFYDSTTRSQTIRITDIKMVDTDPETIIESEYVGSDINEMIFSNTGANDANQTALFVTEEGYLAYVEGDKQYTLEQNVCTGDWVDVAVVRDAGKIIFYINGEKAGSCSVSARTGATPNAKHSIGADNAGNHLFDGTICDVRIWNDARTADEIKNNLVEKNIVALTSNNLDMTDESLIGSWFLVGDIQYVLETMPDNAGGNHAVFCGSRANDWVDYTVPKELGEDYWSMVFIPDIQNLVTGKYTKLWYDMADWIAANVESENIQHVIGAGDSTWSNNDNEYKYAKNGFSKFAGSVSWSNMIGNHDYVWRNSSRDSSKYNSVFGADYINSTYSRFTYEESFADSDYRVSGVENSYYTFTVNGVHWMVLQLEYYPRTNVLMWANEVIQAHPNYNVILTTHAYLDGAGNYETDSMNYTADDDKAGGSLGASTEAIWNKVIAPNANVKMILCGHSTNGEGAIATKTLTNNAGNEVTALMMNVQDLDMTDSNGADTAYYSGQGLGVVNVLRFSADGTKVAVQQYAPGYEKSFGVSSNKIQLSLTPQSCEPVIESIEGVNAGTEPAKKAGYVFAGWFTDAACTKAIATDATNVTAYAKYVDAEVHSVKAQVRLLEDGETDVARDIRFVTTVDSEDYSQVGFEITMRGKTKLVGTDDTYVYKKLLALDDRSKVLTYCEPNAVFSKESAFFKAYIIRNIPYTAYESELITVRAYWKTLDGTDVYGEAVTKSIQEYLQLEDVGNLDKATLYGRSVINSDGELDLFWTNSGLAFNFNGTGATATITTSSVSGASVTDENCSYLNVYVDDAEEPSQTICLTGEAKNYVLAENLETGNHKIELRKRNEAWGNASLLVTIQSIDITGGRFTQQPAVSEYTMEVIGDSITCGYGNMVTDGTGSYSTATEDGTNTYAVLAAKQLGADVSIVSRSGIGFCRGTENCDSIYDHYTKTASLPRNVLNSAEWEFNQKPSDVVVINLGTNDNNATINGTKVTDEYITSEAAAFLQLVREKNPNATIIWAYGIMGNERESAIEAAVKERTEAGDRAVYYLSLAKMDKEKEGTGIASHPTIATHADRAKVLAKFIAEKTGWTLK